jgi:hypothetical protein
VKDLTDKKSGKTVTDFNNQCFSELKRLWRVKLTTSFEEKQSMDEQVTRLRDRINTLSKEATEMRDKYEKYVEETQNQKEN